MDKLILSPFSKEEMKDMIREVISDELAKTDKFKEPDTSLITRKETAKRLGISLPTLHVYTKDGIIPAVRLGSTVKYRICDIEEVSGNIMNIKHSRK